MGFFSNLFGKKDAAITDARRIYSKLMSQARQPAFYGEAKAPDNYDGRIDILTLHIAVVLRALSFHGEQGERLSQALYDVMRDDFEVAMREEGLSDTGIKKRIKPMMKLFFTRVKSYAEAVADKNGQAKLTETFENGLFAEQKTDYPAGLAVYALQFYQKFDGLTLGQIAMTEFHFPASP